MTTDPRDLGGDIADLGGPHDHGQVVIDTRRAILMDRLEVAKVDNPSDGRELVAVLIGGKINQSPDRAKVMLLGDLDMLASFITEAHGLARRMGTGAELERLCVERWERMP
jgi:hypothetical protein